MMLRRSVALILFMVLLLAAGCGKADKGGDEQGNNAAQNKSASEVTDARSLLTKAEAEALLGEPVKEPDYQVKEPMGQQLLFFSAKSDAALKFIQVSVVQNEGMNDSLRSSGYNVTKLYQETKKMFKDNQSVTGIGDEAFWATNGLHILKSNYYVNISTGNTQDPANLELAKKVADKVIPRL